MTQNMPKMIKMKFKLKTHKIGNMEWNGQLLANFVVALALEILL
jgi:hypothetical protein